MWLKDLRFLPFRMRLKNSDMCFFFKYFWNAQWTMGAREGKLPELAPNLTIINYHECVSAKIMLVLHPPPKKKHTHWFTQISFGFLHLKHLFRWVGEAPFLVGPQPTEKAPPIRCFNLFRFWWLGLLVFWKSWVLLSLWDIASPIPCTLHTSTFALP